MNRRIAVLAAATAVLAAGLAIAPAASAASNVAVSIGGPGFAVGYSNRLWILRGCASALRAAPYYAPAPVVTYAPYAPVVYAPYYRPMSLIPTIIIGRQSGSVTTGTATQPVGPSRRSR
jgi:hypothetical protein